MATEEILDRLDKLAVHCMMMDETLGDFLQLADTSAKVDELKDMLEQQCPAEVGQISLGLSMLYEAYILGNAPFDKAEEAVRITNETIEILKDFFGKTSEWDALTGKYDRIINDLKELFQIEPKLAECSEETATAEEDDLWADMDEPANVAEETAEKPLAVDKTSVEEVAKAADGKVNILTTIRLIDENDVVIYESFVCESDDLLSALEEDVMMLEEEPDDMDIINSMFRSFHSLKGASGFLELQEINALCHDTETMMDHVRKGAIKVDTSMIDIILSVRDLLHTGLEHINEILSEGKDNLPNFEGHCTHLEVDVVISAIDRHITLALAGDDTGTPKLGEMLVREKVVSNDELEAALKAKDRAVGEILVEMGVADQKQIDAVVGKQKAIKKKTSISSSIKVETGKLNLLLELVGELVISQAIIAENKVLNNEENSDLAKDIDEMAKITSGIQDHIMGLRMVPLRQTFHKMNRLVRDLCRKTGKNVNFVISGEDTEIDRTLVDELNDPLVHILRNSVDHGIEMADIRQQQGKPKEGTVHLSASHLGGNVVIEVKDDGNGLKYDKILAKAIKSGVAKEGVEYSDEEIAEFIFSAGLSTQDVATDLSGRGVGMDVVRKNVEKLNGRADIQSIRGEGSKITLRLPLTMAIVDGMLVRVGGQKFIIPTISIAESIRPEKEQVTTVVEKGEMLIVRGELIPLVRLNRLFNIPGGNEDMDNGIVIIVSTDYDKRGFLVDDLMGQQQVVIKNLDSRLAGIRGFSGSSILGDGMVGLIIDVAGVFDISSGR